MKVLNAIINFIIKVKILYLKIILKGSIIRWDYFCNQ